MTWLSENWLLVLAIGGFLLLMFRGGGMMGCGMGGHGVHGTRHGSRSGTAGADTAPDETPIDPVSREAVPGDSAIASYYRGRIYRFATRENRDRFESAPEQYALVPAADASAPSQPQSRSDSDAHSHGQSQRGHCC